MLSFVIISERTLCKIPKFHLIFWLGKFVEKQSFHTRKLVEITTFYAVKQKDTISRSTINSLQMTQILKTHLAWMPQH